MPQADKHKESLLRLLGARDPGHVKQGCQLLLTLADDPAIQAWATELILDARIVGYERFCDHSYVNYDGRTGDDWTAEALDTYKADIAYGGKLFDDYGRFREFCIDPGTEIHELVIPECRDEVALFASRVAGTLVRDYSTGTPFTDSKRGVFIGASHFLDSLDFLEGLSEIERLTFYTCPALKDLSALQSLNNLQEFGFAWCSFSDLPPLTQLEQLSLVEIGDVKNLSSLESLAGLNQLEQLYLHRTVSLENLDGLQNAANLRTLKLESKSLKNIDALRGLTDLRDLEIRNYGSKLTQLDLSTLSTLTGLESLRLEGFTELQNLGFLLGLANLQNVSLVDCQALNDVSGLEGSTGLEFFFAEGCGFETLDSLSAKHRSLHLTVRECDALVDAGNLTALSGLVSLTLGNCPRLSQLPDFEQFSDLESLYIWGCPEIPPPTEEDLEPLKQRIKRVQWR